MPRISEAFLAIVDLSLALGVKPKDMPGVWTHEVDEHWTIHVNAHSEEKRIADGTEVAPFCAYLEYCGIPVGILNPVGGVITAGHDGETGEDEFIAALRAAAERARTVRVST